MIINLSGHPIPDTYVNGEQVGDERIVTVPIPNVPLEEEGTIAKTAQDITEALKEQGLRKSILKGEYELLLPGMTSLAVSVLVLLHGITGHYPPVLYSVRVGGEFRLCREGLDLEFLRMKGREIRNQMI